MERLRNNNTIEKKGKQTKTYATDLESIITEDGILYSILSSLPLREAARTCLLSRRWGQLWNHRHILKFDAENMFGARTARSLDDYYDSNPHNYEEKYAVVLTDKFVKSVDSVLQQHQGARVEKIWVKFFLDKAKSHHLDAWLRFAVESKTKFIILNLWPYDTVPHAKERYEFPCQLFFGHQGSAVEYLSISFCSFKPLIGFSGLNNLRSLNLTRLDVTDEDVKCLLSNCSNLERLFMICCPQLVALSISHPLSRLRTLSVLYCDDLKKIEIKARNLTWLRYEGSWVDLKFRESSQLEEAIIVFITDDIMGIINFSLTKLSSKLPHLVKLKLETKDVPEVAYLPKDFIPFAHLKFLYWIPHSKMSLICLVSLLNAAPLLEEFRLEFRNRVEDKPPPRLKKLWRKLPKQPRRCLKTVSIGPFYGDKWQTEIALYLLENAIDLKTMTIKTCKSFDEDILEVAINYLRRKYPTIVIRQFTLENA